MAPTGLMISTDSHGDCMEGFSFDNSSIISNEVLTRIVLFYGEYIDSLTMHYTGGSTPVTRGRSSGSRVEIVLGPGEFITAVKGCFSGKILQQLGFTNNKGLNFGPYGWGEDINITDRFDWKSGDNAPADLAGRMGLHHFSGRAGNYIHQLRATFSLYPVATETSTNVEFEPRINQEPTESGVHLSSFARNMMSPIVELHVGPDAIVFHTNEATLCRLPFFRAALQGEFQETVEKKITIPEEKPEIISALIEYISTGNYTYTYDIDASTGSDGTPPPNLAQGCFHVEVYAVAQMYDLPPLVSDALDNFCLILSQLDGMDIVRLWKAAYEKGLTLPMSALACHLDVLEERLPKLLKGLYQTDGEEMDIMVAESPALASDLMRFLVASCED